MSDKGFHVFGGSVGVRAALARPWRAMSTQNPGAGRKVTVLDLREMKERGERITVLTAYDFLFARLVDSAGTDVILVGDSLAEVVLGLDSTLPVTLDDMIHHARAVVRGVKRALVVVDMPFLSYQISAEEAVRNAGRILKESGGHAVKVEGGDEQTAETVAAIIRAGIPVMGHIGFTPQSRNALGGYRVQGRGAEGSQRLIEEARRLEEAGAFAIVLEMIPGDAAQAVTGAVKIPTIGIGAGADCDGQVLVIYDMLGLNEGFQPRFLRRFGSLGQDAERAIQGYLAAVRSGEYPAGEHTYD